MRVITLLLFAVYCGFPARANDFEVTVQPLANEDFVPCHYALSIPHSGHAIRAVWVIFDRGRDVHRFYKDPTVVAFARRFNIAVLLA
jgi:hypothetical protein